MQEQRDKIQLERHTRKILQHLRTRPDVFSLRAVHAPVRVLEKAQAKVSQPSTLTPHVGEGRAAGSTVIF